MILACSHVSKAFLGQTIFTDCSFHIEAHEKAALTGINGAGKSTLLKIITQELNPDSGEVYLAKDAKLGYLAQHQIADSSGSIYAELMDTRKDLLALEQNMRQLEADMTKMTGEQLEDALVRYDRMNHSYEQQNGYALHSEVIGILKGLGFSEADFNQTLDTLSGGQKTRVALGKLLLSKPDILLLDEPTNHLDLNSITWLENYLLNYPGSVLIVSHDRYFLDRIVTRVIELENGRLQTYPGNYTEFSKKKQMIRDNQLKAWYNQQQEIRHQEEVIARLRSFNREKSIRRAESREKMLDKLERVEKPIEFDAGMHLHLEPAILSGNDVLHTEDLTKQYGNHVLFSHAGFDIRRGEKVAVIGNNGTGKTTLLKILTGMINADSGSFRLGSNVLVGYYDQEQQVLHMDKNIFEEISDAHPQMTNTEIRNLLAGFLFTGEDVYKQVSALSGGERGRVSLALLMLSDANFLILDEPTNHLDMISREILERTIRDYEGTVLYVSHDRYFINQTATRILELKNNQFINYIGNYDYYLEKRDILSSLSAPDLSAAPLTESSSKADWQMKKEEAARQRKLENELKKTEEAIADWEAKKDAITAELTQASVFSDVAKLMKLQKKEEEADRQLTQLYEKWEELASLVME